MYCCGSSSLRSYVRVDKQVKSSARRQTDKRAVAACASLASGLRHTAMAWPPPSLHSACLSSMPGTIDTKNLTTMVLTTRIRGLGGLGATTAAATASALAADNGGI
jgi:hypothetical protein